MTARREHKWDGPPVAIEGAYGDVATCSICGCDASDGRPCLPMTMVEKVASAMQRTMAGDDLTDDAAQRLARAAIEAMREPSTDMVIAGMDASPYRFDPTREWEAMIASALAENAPT